MLLVRNQPLRQAVDLFYNQRRGDSHWDFEQSSLVQTFLDVQVAIEPSLRFDHFPVVVH